MLVDGRLPPLGSGGVNEEGCSGCVNLSGGSLSRGGWGFHTSGVYICTFLALFTFFSTSEILNLCRRHLLRAR